MYHNAVPSTTYVVTSGGYVPPQQVVYMHGAPQQQVVYAQGATVYSPLAHQPVVQQQQAVVQAKPAETVVQAHVV